MFLILCYLGHVEKSVFVRSVIPSSAFIFSKNQKCFVCVCVCISAGVTLSMHHGDFTIPLIVYLCRCSRVVLPLTSFQR